MFMARQKYAIMNQKSLTSPVADTDLMDASALSLKTVHGVLAIKKVLCKTVGIIDFVG